MALPDVDQVHEHTTVRVESTVGDMDAALVWFARQLAKHAELEHVNMGAAPCTVWLDEDQTELIQGVGVWFEGCAS